MPVWRELREAVASGADGCPDAADTGQYAALLLRDGPTVASAAFPDVSQHLTKMCAACQELLGELLALLSEADP